MLHTYIATSGVISPSQLFTEYSKAGFHTGFFSSGGGRVECTCMQGAHVHVSAPARFCRF